MIDDDWVLFVRRILEDLSQSQLKFSNCLTHLQTKYGNITLLKDADGDNILHLVIKCKRISFIQVSINTLQCCIRSINSSSDYSTIYKCFITLIIIVIAIWK